MVVKGLETAILVESTAYEGVKRVATKLAEDFERVLGVRLPVVDESGFERYHNVIYCGTLGKSEGLTQQNLSALEGKRECYRISFTESKDTSGKMLTICGSDKRGTIYGMFALSEYIGVSPLHFWGDAQPVRKAEILISEDIECVSKEPSVRYRGFFINDEWPCFGTWCNKHYGGFNADCYENVFELLLRLKGNYLWPAMWSASFPLDGPGSANEELADIYGVVMGYSHHEPCLRASEEWDKVRGPESKYGNEWNFYTNEQGLLNYWADALKRSGKYENLITIGMRGERDTSMLGENATIQENVNLLKDIIRKQRQLIKENVNEDLSQVPQLLALYKEVEAYFYGDETVEGLKDWEELDGVICMLCEDNFGHMRTLPTPEVRGRKGGFGMYYHLDYHGGPISYEWVDSTPLSLIWEQMSQAYEYGVRDAWIVNVGDLKFHEVPLSYFLNLAYDYEKWGYGNPESYAQYTRVWAEQNFPLAGAELWQKISKVFTDYIQINHMRRPEALNEYIYHPCHFGEADYMLKWAEEVEKLSAEVYEKLSDGEKDAYYSMVHFSAMASMNLLKMQLYAGKNRHFAKQGKPIANHYGEASLTCMKKDRALLAEFADFKDGKWDGMQLAQHIGFTKWNEDDYRYPVISHVEPAYKPRLKVSRKDAEWCAVKNYGAPMALVVDDFCWPEVNEVVLEVANDGVGCVNYKIVPDGEMPGWLSVSKTEGEVSQQDEVTIVCHREMLSCEAATARLYISDGDTNVAVDITAKGWMTDSLPEGIHMPRRGIVCFGAQEFADKKNTPNGRFEIMQGYGKYGCGVKVFPSTAWFEFKEDKPELEYTFWAEESGEYCVDLVLAPNNTVRNHGEVNVEINVGGCLQLVNVLPTDFGAGEGRDVRWANAVLNQERVVSCRAILSQGVNKLVLAALEPGTVFERVIIYPSSMCLPESYLGPR